MRNEDASIHRRELRRRKRDVQSGAATFFRLSMFSLSRTAAPFAPYAPHSENFSKQSGSVSYSCVWMWLSRETKSPPFPSSSSVRWSVEERGRPFLRFAALSLDCALRATFSHCIPLSPFFKDGHPPDQGRSISLFPPSSRIRAGLCARAQLRGEGGGMCCQKDTSSSWSPPALANIPTTTTERLSFFCGRRRLG